MAVEMNTGIPNPSRVRGVTGAPQRKEAAIDALGEATNELFSADWSTRTDREQGPNVINGRTGRLEQQNNSIWGALGHLLQGDSRPTGSYIQPANGEPAAEGSPDQGASLSGETTLDNDIPIPGAPRHQVDVRDQ